ncbi:hypothetical protein K458DRAFT_406631 [Lentithecium fluviatile CBS 122367]|uniref:Helix-turn-helix domain-containing protein n=1 Tax=Lentithecium fluviatile CBS 122367 TaxID=1168545 RepID=A0A6G1ITS8_9PLEO|nr:hypothetical protein K458DRAFT_406631 [Lentithecium fluviatile CBS 122367]
MGSSASKGAKAAGAAARKYPTRSPPSTTRTPAPSAAPAQQYARNGPSVHPPPHASEAKTEAINLDARDPVLASRLNSLGAVQPNPHYSATSTSSFDPHRNDSSMLPSDMMSAPPQSAFPDLRDNPALRVLEARQKIQEEADQELANVGRKGFAGRKYVDASVIQLALMRKARGESDARIEDALTIKRGRLGVLGNGIAGSVST